MPAKDLGIKFTCFKCGTRFYDLKKPEPICPKCGADQRQVPASKPSGAAEKRRAPPKPAPAKPPPEEVDAEKDLEDDVEADDDAEDEAEEPDEH